MRVVAMAALTLVVACAAPTPTLLATSTPSPTLATATPSPIAPVALIKVNNSTTIDVTVAINDSVVVTVPANAGFYPVSYDLPALPFTVDVRSPNGRILASVSRRSGDGVGDNTTAGRGLFLACGQLFLWVGPGTGDFLPVTGATPAPCD